MNHELATISLQGPGKLRCGDHVVVQELDGGAAVALVVCDGVGSHSFDWLASKTACRTIATVLTETTGAITPRLVDAVESAHVAVQQFTGPSAGAATTLVLVCWEVDSDRCRYVSIGDSRLYHVGDDGITQVTEDDSASVPVRIAGELALSSGSVAFRQGLTRAIGHGALGEVRVEELQLDDGQALAATSDGFHEMPGFLRALAGVHAAHDLDAAIAVELVPLHQTAGRDDATMAMLRRGTITDVLRDQCRRALQGDRADADLRHVPIHVLRRCLVAVVTGALHEGKATDASRGLDLLTARDVHLSRDQVVGLLDAVRDDGSPGIRAVHQRLVRLAGQAR